MEHTLRQHIEKVVTLTDDEFTLVLSHFTSSKVRKRAFLIEVGNSVKYAYFVVSGLLKLVYSDEEGRESIVSFAMEDWWESDYQAYFNKTKATLSLQCLEDTEMYCLALDDYHKLCTSMPKMQYFFLEKATRGHIGSQQRIISLLTQSAKERYDHLLNRYPALFQRVSKTLLASYLGVSRETLSRLSS